MKKYADLNNYEKREITVYKYICKTDQFEEKIINNFYGKEFTRVF